ncbi:hypothetical protein PPAR_a1980 [Pseudoalteromonas paragorgicola KMM 3548]|nr:hypothetical protein [Pseudoalteromonas distincta KMM 3548]
MVTWLELFLFLAQTTWYAIQSYQSVVNRIFILCVKMLSV